MPESKWGWSLVTDHPAFAGLLGALVSLGLAPGARWGERAFNVFCGVAISWNMAAPLTEYLRLDVARFSGAVGFMLGLAGMHVVHALLSWLQDGGFLSFLKDRR